jgi:Tfp pilus assembly protein PilO
MMMRGTQHTQTRKAILLAGVLFLTVIIGMVFVQGNLRKGNALTEERDALSTELTRLTDTFAAVQQGKEVLESMRQDLAAYGSMVRPEIEFKEFYQELTTLTTENDISISELVPGDVESLDGYSRMPIKINGNGNFKNLHRFMNSMGQHSISTGFDQLELTPSGESGLCTFGMSLYIFSADLE